MTIEECTFAADYYIPVCVDESPTVYERIYQVVKTWPDPYRRQRGQHAEVSVVLMDPNHNSVRTLLPHRVHPADPEKFRESWEAHKKRKEDKK